MHDFTNQISNHNRLRRAIGTRRDWWLNVTWWCPTYRVLTAEVK